MGPLPPVINSDEQLGALSKRDESWLINTPADWDPQKVGGSVPLNPLPNSPPRRSSILLCTPFSKLKVLYSLVLIVLIVFGAVQGR